MQKHAPEAPSPREAPKDLDLEQVLLGTLLIRNDALHEIPALLPEHFFDPLHGAIFAAAEQMILKGMPATPLTLRSRFETAESINQGVTVPQYIGSLAAKAGPVSNVRPFAQILYDLAARRALIVAGEDLVAEAFDTAIDRSAAELIEMAEARLYAIAPKQGNEQQETSLASALRSTLANANEAYRRGDGLSGHSTGLRGLDARTGGLADGNLIIIAGRPGMGKTALAINVADNLAQAGVPVAFYSLEMSEAELGARILARHAKLAVHKITRGQFNQTDMAAMLKAEQRLAEVPITIDPTGGPTIPQPRARARRPSRKSRLGALFVGYFQLMEPAHRSSGNRTTDITEITNGLKAIAKEFGVPVIALSQLNRAVEARDNKRPQMMDLRESGSIEQDADVILMCFREEYYLEREKPAASDREAYGAWIDKLEAIRGQAEILVVKSRQGTLGTVEVTFDGPTTTFSDREAMP